MSKGERNGYQCQNPKCGYLLVTIDLDDGVTPMTKLCPKCRGIAYSMWYRDVPADLPVEGYWFKPKSTRGMTAPMRDHVERGGLDYRETES